MFEYAVGQGRQRLHGEVVRHRRPGRPPDAQGGRGLGEEEPQGGRGLHVAPLDRPGRRSSSGSTTGRSATCTRCGSTASTGRSTAPPSPRSQRAGLPAPAPQQLHVALRRLLHRLALPQRRRGLLGQGGLARLGPGHGRALLPEAGNQFDHYTVEFTFADGAKLFAFSRHMNGCWQTYCRLRPRHRRARPCSWPTWREPKPRIYKSQNMVKENLVWELRPAGLQPLPRRVAGAAGRHPPGQAAQRGRAGPARPSCRR